jgi:hypothetical protein
MNKNTKQFFPHADIVVGENKNMKVLTILLLLFACKQVTKGGKGQRKLFC